jgi:hypothetical protein
MATIKTKQEIQRWVALHQDKDPKLYAKYGKPLEQEHQGKFIAINSGGQVILGKSMTEVMLKAVEKFGRENFALARVGHEAVWKCTGLFAEKK